MHPTHAHDATQRTEPEATTVPALKTQAALVAAPPLALWAATHPAAALAALAVLAALTWHRRVAPQRARPRPTRSPD